MLTLYHAPQSRSSRIVTLIDELGAQDRVTIRDVRIRRTMTGGGARDPLNPHPEGKVPFLTDGATAIRETPAIILYLTERFPEAGMGIAPGHPDRGAFLSWLFYYGSVVEPVLIFEKAGLSHPLLAGTFRGMAEVIDSLATALADRPYLMGEAYTAADLLLSSPFAWFPEAMPDMPAIQDWGARCQARPSIARTTARDEVALAAFA